MKTALNGIASVCFFIRVAAGCQLVTRHHDSPALLSAAISFSILVSGLPSRLWTGPQCAWWKLLFLCWELALKASSYIGAIFFLSVLLKFRGLGFVRLLSWSFVRSFDRAFVLLFNCCILLQITLPLCLELMTTVFMLARQTTNTMTMRRSFCTVKFCRTTEIFWWVLIANV